MSVPNVCSFPAAMSPRTPMFFEKMYSRVPTMATAGTDDGDRVLVELLVAPLHVRALARDVVLLELALDVPDLDALFEVVVLVGVDELQELAAVEDNRVVPGGLSDLPLPSMGLSGSSTRDLGFRFPVCSSISEWPSMSVENRRGSPPFGAGSSSRYAICRSGYARSKNSAFSSSSLLNLA